jgi:hypothetical protein
MLLSLIKRTISAAICCVTMVGCGLINNEVIDPDDSLDPLLKISGQISNSFTQDFSKLSPRIALYPANFEIYSEKVRTKEFQDRFFNPLFNKDSIAITYPAITFNGKFPLEFTSELTSLPASQYILPYRSPSGREIKIAIFAIMLFDDVNKDGKVTLSMSTDSSTGGFGFSPNTDTLLGVCENQQILYVEDASIIPELNAYITEHLGSGAIWEQLHNGFNLIETVSPPSGNIVFKGVKRATDTDITIKRMSMYETSEDYDTTYNPFITATSIFYFQRDYSTFDFTTLIAVPRDGAQSLHITSSYPLTTSQMKLASTEQEPISHINSGKTFSSYISFTIMTYGIFDNGYLNYSIYSQEQSIELLQSHSRCTVNGSLLNGKDSRITGSDTINNINIVELSSDTLKIDFDATGPTEQGGNLKPIMIREIGVTIIDRGPFNMTTDGKEVDNPYAF